MGYSFIFDMDGVVIDSNPFHKIAWERFLERKGISYEHDVFEKLISGRNGVYPMKVLFGQDISREVITAYVNEIEREFREIFRQSDVAEPTPGLERFLKAIRVSGYKTALATSAPAANVDLILEKTNLRPFFQVILDQNDVTHGKPDPEIYLKTLKRLEAKREECIVFEDSRVGISSALAAGIKVVGISTGHNRRELHEAGVSKVIEDFIDLDPEDVLTLIR